MALLHSGLCDVAGNKSQRARRKAQGLCFNPRIAQSEVDFVLGLLIRYRRVESVLSESHNAPVQDTGGGLGRVPATGRSGVVYVTECGRTVTPRCRKSVTLFIKGRDTRRS